MNTLEICAVGSLAVGIFTLLWKVYFGWKQLAIMSEKNSRKVKHAEPFMKKLGLSFFKKYPMRQAYKAAINISRSMSNENFHPTLIVGIGRGGAIFGSIISYNFFHTPILAVDRTYIWDEQRKDSVLFDFTIPKDLSKDVLIVAGEAHTGNTMGIFKDFILKSNPDANIKTAVFYKQDVCTSSIDYCGNSGPDAPLMPWQDAGYIRDSLSPEEGKRLKDERV